MKKVLVMVLSIMLWMPAWTIHPLAADAVEFLQNGGFETLGTAAPAGWTFSGGYGNGYVIDTAVHYAGEKALKMENTGTALYAYQNLEGFQGGTEYTLEAAIRAQDYKGTALEIKFEFYSVDMYGKRVSIGGMTLEPAPQKNNQWEFFTYKVTVPENTYFANVLFRLPGNRGTIWYDALSLVGPRTNEPSPDIHAEDLPVYPVFPMHAEGQELIVNGDMNEQSGWTCSNAEKVMFVSSPARGDSAAIKITATDEEETPYCYYVLQNVKENAQYQVSVYMCSPMLRGKGFGFKYEFLKNNKSISGVESGRTRCITGTNWMRFTQTFRVPKGADGVRILFRLFGTGTVYIDDASCYMTEKAYVFDMETDEIFYYSDAENASVTMSLNPDKVETLSGEAAVCTLVGEGVSEERRAVVNGDTVTFSLPLSGLLKETAYTVSTTLSGVTKTEAIYVYDRPTRFDADGNYRLDDGTVFDPIFAYHIDSVDFKKAKAAGINLVQGAPKAATLSAAEDEEIMVLAMLYNDSLPAGHPANAESTRQTVEKYKDHPSIYAWCIMDEPYSNNPGASADLAASYKLIRDIDKTHPVFVMQDGAEFEEVSKYTDILGIDPYPAGKEEPLEIVYERTQMAAETGKPVYCLQQAFEYGNWFPSADEIINMNAQALLAGAKGIGYYEWNKAKNGAPLYKTEIWDSIVDWNLNCAPILFEGMVHSTYDKGVSGKVRYAALAKGEKQYLLLQNTAATRQTATISLPAENMLIQTDREDVSAIVGGQSLSITVPASAAVFCEAIRRADKIYLCIGDRIIRSPMPGDTICADFPDGEGEGFLAAYSGAELLKIAMAGETITIDENMDRIKAFYWCALQPLCESESWNVEKG